MPKLNWDDISWAPVVVPKLNWDDVSWAPGVEPKLNCDDISWAPVVVVVNWVVLFCKFCKKSLSDEDESTTGPIIGGDKNGLFKLALISVLVVPKPPNPPKLLYWFSVVVVVVVCVNVFAPVVLLAPGRFCNNCFIWSSALTLLVVVVSIVPKLVVFWAFPNVFMSVFPNCDKNWFAFWPPKFWFILYVVVSVVFVYALLKPVVNTFWSPNGISNWWDIPWVVT